MVPAVLLRDSSKFQYSPVVWLFQSNSQNRCSELGETKDNEGEISRGGESRKLQLGRFGDVWRVLKPLNATGE